MSQGNISRQEAVSMIPPLLLKIEPHHKVALTALLCNPDHFLTRVSNAFEFDHACALADFGYVCCSWIKDGTAYRDAPF